MKDCPIGDGFEDVKMYSNANLIRVIMIIVLLATPAVGMRILSNYYDEPYLQPLALTKEGVAAAEERRGGRRFARIDVHVGWGRDWTGTMTRTKLREVITATLQHQTEFYHFEFNDQPGGQVDITFVVGPNSYGPFPPGRMATGIKSALIALRMTNGPEG